ncbi:MAG: hypothetical protein J5758_05955, partial [Abditibacteriota bacterium]|nr:hypothetical protein [Abditibacteriota bacterium]
MKSLTIYIPIIALFIIGALALYGSASGNKIVLKDAGAARAASGKSGEQAWGAVNIDEVDKT